MAYQVIFKKQFQNKLLKLLAYLEKEWNKPVADAFLQKLDKRIAILKNQPYIGNPSQTVQGVRGILISRQNKMYYKISGNAIVVLNMYDMRINPKRNRYL